MNISLVVTDLDGTLWNSEDALPPESAAGLAELEALGVPVLAATARRPRNTAGPFRRLGIDLPFVSLDGAIGFESSDDFDAGSTFVDRLFPVADAEVCLQIFADNGLSPCLYPVDAISDIAISRTPSTCLAHQKAIVSNRRVVDDGELGATLTHRMSILGVERGRLQACFDQLRQLDMVEVVLAPEPTYGEWGLTVAPRNVNKWSAVQAFCTLRGLDPAKVLAVGDGANDVSMLTQAALSVAVQGGHPDAVALASETIPPPELGGWALLPGLLTSARR